MSEPSAKEPAARRRRRRKYDKPLPRHYAEYAAVRAVGFILRRMPVEAASAVMGGALRLVMPRTSRHRRVLEHLELAMPELDAAQREKTARRMWSHLGRVAGEAFHMDRLLVDDSRVEMPADFERFAALGRDGAISAALHLGNWEIAGVLPRRAGLRLAGVYQAIHNPLVEEYLKAMRAPVFPAGLYPKGPDLGHKLRTLAREGAGIGIVSDLRELRGVQVTFFGKPAYATPLPAMLARATGRPIIAGVVTRKKGVRFKAELAHVEVPVTDDRHRDVREATQALHDVFERWIRAHPEQWMWSHRKWAMRKGTRPLTAGEASFPAELVEPGEGERTGPAVR